MWKQGQLTKGTALPWHAAHMNATPQQIKEAGWDPKTTLQGGAFFSRYCKVGIGYPCIVTFKKTAGFVAQQRTHKKFDADELAESLEAIRYFIETAP